MIGLACLIGAILSALVLGLAVIVMDLRRDVRALRGEVSSLRSNVRQDMDALHAALPKKRVRKPKAVQS